MNKNIILKESGNTIEKSKEQTEKKILEKTLKKVEKYLEKMERLYYESIKKNKILEEKVQKLTEELEEQKEHQKGLNNVTQNVFQFSKALAYSTARFLPHSMHLENPEKLIKLIQKYDLKDPEQYPIGTYKARKDRLRSMMEWVREKGRITTRDLVNKFRICNPTARADMRDLLDAFPKALKLFIPKSRGRESYVLEVRSNALWGLTWTAF